jgi:hypothetical protein
LWLRPGLPPVNEPVDVVPGISVVAPGLPLGDESVLLPVTFVPGVGLVVAVDIGVEIYSIY